MTNDCKLAESTISAEQTERCFVGMNEHWSVLHGFGPYFW